MGGNGIERGKFLKERGQGNFFRISTFSLVETSVFFLFEQFDGQCCYQSTTAPSKSLIFSLDC